MTLSVVVESVLSPATLTGPWEFKRATPGLRKPVMTAASFGPGTFPPTQLLPAFQSPPVGATEVFQAIMLSSRRDSRPSTQKQRRRLRRAPASAL